MKLIFRDYLASLREREELDAILPDLLSELGYTVISRPQRGTTQAGVDIAAVGKDEDGERKLFLFSVKQGDLTRQSWDGTPQALRSSLNQILDTYIPTRVPKKYQDLKVVICLVFGGDVQEQVRTDVTGFTRNNSSDRISFDEWNGDKLAGLLMQGVLRDEIMPKEVRSRFQKAVAMVDEPEIAYRHFERFIRDLTKEVTNDKARIRVARQIYIALSVLYVWARDIDNIEAPYKISEIAILNIWNLLRPTIGSRRKAANEAITSVLLHAIQLHIVVATVFLVEKILPHVGVKDGISISIPTRTSVDVNLKLFDLLGRIALMGLLALWRAEKTPEGELKAGFQQQLAQLTAMGFQLIDNNRALFLPLQDQQTIEITLFLILVAYAGGNFNDVRAWLSQMVDKEAMAIRQRGHYTCVFQEYRDLVAHPRDRTNDYFEEATSGSTLIPTISAFLSALGDGESLETIVRLKAEELGHCTLQLWMPDQTSEDRIYAGATDHGSALTGLSVTSTGKELVETIQKACKENSEIAEMSAMKTGYWPIVLMACRHYRLPIPPQFWIDMVVSNTMNKDSE